MAFLNWRCLLPRARFSSNACKSPERVDAFRQRRVKAAIVSIMVGEVRVSRTPRRPMRTTAGFEDREGHRSPSTSAYDRLCHYHTNRGLLRENELFNNQVYPAGKGWRLLEQARARIASRGCRFTVSANRPQSSRLARAQ